MRNARGHGHEDEESVVWLARVPVMVYYAECVCARACVRVSVSVCVRVSECACVSAHGLLTRLGDCSGFSVVFLFVCPSVSPSIFARLSVCGCAWLCTCAGSWGLGVLWGGGGAARARCSCNCHLASLRTHTHIHTSALASSRFHGPLRTASCFRARTRVCVCVRARACVCVRCLVAGAGSRIGRSGSSVISTRCS